MSIITGAFVWCNDRSSFCTSVVNNIKNVSIDVSSGPKSWNYCKDGSVILLSSQ
ncbi:MAG: hypothetical protein ACXW07_09745 [Nitrososphaeraceae archaeon]